MIGSRNGSCASQSSEACERPALSAVRGGGGARRCRTRRRSGPLLGRPVGIVLGAVASLRWRPVAERGADLAGLAIGAHDHSRRQATLLCFVLWCRRRRGTRAFACHYASVNSFKQRVFNVVKARLKCVIEGLSQVSGALSQQCSFVSRPRLSDPSVLQYLFSISLS
jgi:hypothetical protein